MVQVFDEMDDPYLSTRKDDVLHVVQRIQKILVHGKGADLSAEEGMNGRVIIAQDLTPAQVAVRLRISEGSVKRHLARARGAG